MALIPDGSHTLVHFTLTKDGAQAPSRPDEDSNGYDLYAAPDRETLISSNEWEVIDTGVQVALPKNTLGFITPRSGLAAKHGVTVLNSPGLIDSGYRGNIGVILYNNSVRPYLVKPGERIAQLVVMYQGQMELKEISNDEFENISVTERGVKGFGSSGK